MCNDLSPQQEEIFARSPTGGAIVEMAFGGMRLCGREFAVNQQRNSLCPIAAHKSLSPEIIPTV
jgi:hypothetical protein